MGGIRLLVNLSGDWLVDSETMSLRGLAIVLAVYGFFIGLCVWLVLR